MRSNLFNTIIFITLFNSLKCETNSQYNFPSTQKFVWKRSPISDKNTLCTFYIIVYYVTTESTLETQLKTYKNYINASHDLDKSDRNILRTWTTDFQIQLVNVTSKYRLEMTRHKEQSFTRIKSNFKWNECFDLHKNEIDNAERSYYSGESNCLRTANTEEAKKRRSVHQVEKEIKKWRKSYKYLQSQCNLNNPGDEEAAGLCLIEYIEKDNYHITFQRLMLLKMESMSSLYSQILSSVKDCESCLKNALHQYLSDVRSIMNNLNRCYRRTD